jgi:uncharacterized membrane protein
VGRSARLAAVDWLRGLAVVLMIQTHLYDSWTSPAGKATAAYQWTRFLGGIPSRLFLLLVGVSMAIKFEAQIARGTDRRTMYRGAIRRGLEIVLLAYLFRLQEFTLSGFGGDWRGLFRIDILNCIGASMVLIPIIVAPRNGRPQILAALAAALAVIALGPVIGPYVFPRWLPEPLTAYLGGPRPMAWFPLFPWMAWPLIGVAVGHFWVRWSRDAKRQALAFVLTGIGGMAIIYTVILIRRINPYIIHYPSDLVQQMGPGSFFYRLGMLGPIALLAYIVTLVRKRRFSVMQQLGQTSLLVYWIHVDLCYGMVSSRLHGRLSMFWATVGFVSMTAVMLAISIFKTRFVANRRRQTGAPQPASAPSPTPTGA